MGLSAQLEHTLGHKYTPANVTSYPFPCFWILLFYRDGWELQKAMDCWAAEKVHRKSWAEASAITGDLHALFL